MASPQRQQEVQASWQLNQRQQNKLSTGIDKIDSPTVTSDKPIRLERKLGLLNGVSIIVGVIVGSGIFISPTGVYTAAGTIGSAIIVWGICGLLSLLGALCMAELGTSIPDSGGDYSYIMMAYGPCVSFLYLWVTALIILPCSNALSAITFANYVLQPFYGDCTPDGDAIRLFALALILILVWVNCYSVDLSIKLQNAFTITKVLALILVIVFGFYHIITGAASNRLSPDKIWDDSKITLTGLAAAFYHGLYSYAGWNALNFVTEEIKHPVRNMPRAIIISITSITIIYILVNLAYFAVLDDEQIRSSEAIAVTFGRHTLGVASFLMPLSVALSTTSGLNALIFSSSRVLFVGARQGQLFSLLNMISINNKTPVPSLLFVGFMSSIYLCITKIGTLINYLVFIEASFGGLAVSTLLVLRYKMPNIDRPLRVHTYIPIVYLIVSSVLIAAPIKESPYEAMVGTIILLTGIPVYYLTADWKVKPDSYQKVIDKVNGLTQKLTLSMTPEKSLDLD